MSKIPRTCGELERDRKIDAATERILTEDAGLLQRLADEQPAPNYERQLAGRFLALPFRHQAAVAGTLDVLTGAEWRIADDQEFFLTLFKRAHEKGLLAKLWDATEKLHDNPATFNPFETQDERLPIERLAEECRAEDADIARIVADNFSEMYEPLDEQPDTVPVPPKSERDGVWVSREKYERMRAFAKFGEAVFWGFWNDGEPCDFDGWELQNEAAEADLLRSVAPKFESDPSKDADLEYQLVPVYEPKGGE